MSSTSPLLPQQQQRADRGAVRCFRALLYLYPGAFRASYGQEMIQTFRDCYAEARQGGAWGAARLWVSLVYDALWAASVEYLRAFVAQMRRLLGLKTPHAQLSGYAMSMDVALRSDTGRLRANNEDCGVYVIPDDTNLLEGKGALFVVADGMGGYALGEVASDIVTQTVRSAYYEQEGDDTGAALIHAVQAAHTAVRARAPEGVLMGSTCVAAVVRGERMYVVNVGDSRAYLVRAGEIRQISRDHSLVAELVRAGLLSKEQARTHEQRNLITRAVGTDEEVKVDLFVEEVREGDILLLCTDGLSVVVDEEEMHTVVEELEPEEAVRTLIERANARGGPDNITAVVARVAPEGLVA